MQLFITTCISNPKVRQTLNRVCIALAGCWLLFLWANLSTEIDDFRQYWQAARNIIQDGNAYATTEPAFAQLPEAQRPPAYPNPPLLAYLLQPLALLPLDIARQIWFVLNCVVAISLIMLIVAKFATHQVQQWWGLILLLGLVAPTTRVCLQLGQLGLWLGLLIIAGFVVSQRHPRSTGVLLAFGTLIKLYPGLITLYYVFRWRRVVVVSAIISGLVIIIGSILIHGFEPYVAYAQRVLFAGYYPYEAEFNISFVGFWRRLLVESDYGVAVTNSPLLATVCIAVCTALLLAVCSWLTYRVRANDLQPAIFGFWVCAMLLISPVNGYYNLVALLLPILVVTNRLLTCPNRVQRNLFFIALLAINIPPAWSNGLPDLYNAVHIGWGLILLTPSIYGVLVLFSIIVTQLQAQLRQPATIV